MTPSIWHILDAHESCRLVITMCRLALPTYSKLPPLHKSTETPAHSYIFKIICLLSLRVIVYECYCFSRTEAPYIVHIRRYIGHDN